MWGKKLKERLLGTVEEFCPLHRKIHLFEIFAVMQYTHIYLIAIGKGKLVHHVIRGHGHDCGHVAVVDALEQKRASALTRHAERLEVETSLAENAKGIATEERQFLLAEQISSTSEALKHGLSNDAISAAQKRPMAISIGIALVSMILWGVTGSPAFALPFLGGLIALPFAFIRPRQKLQKRHNALVLDTVLRFGLSPLCATQSELEQAFAWGKAQGFTLTRRQRKTLLRGTTSPTPAATPSTPARVE